MLVARLPIQSSNEGMPIYNDSMDHILKARQKSACECECECEWACRRAALGAEMYASAR